ncbi:MULTISPECIES: citrate/2-methylcitrate synthase [unclassified Paraburkholderia]|uniref:citrate/2-methylcitrate synthase n=1 Tax=unclassified Paraburkholderia TaxID=2615204 RepID=UPI00160A27FB|nr:MULTISPECIES: citrate/2-methylcitrate synthase [unclassified Paraburkholderia]MBB5444321.1 citrate synthase [Paraburkholderia sp. WSM4177]MBB5484564.1 citrate synthase [Paraburkholderia sp. WSM4180]
MPAPIYLTAAEAAATLGVSLPTLYAYVSRGMLGSSPDTQGRHRLYDAAEVRRLARRKADGKRAGKVAQKVLDWGVPVLESSITLVADGRPLYRGHDAIELARSASLEDIAALLWECSARRIADAPVVPLAPAQWAAWLKLWSDSTPLDRALVLLPTAAAQMPRVWALGRDAQLDTACAVMRLLAAAMLPAAPSNEPLHRQIATAWRVRSRQQSGLLRAALVACADHELNASTFTVRCITSTGAHLFGAVAGGLAALSGPRHGGETVRIAALLDEASRSPELDRYLANRLARYEHGAQGPVLSGFGHPLYPDGDPRARLLLTMLADCAPARSPLNEVLQVERAVRDTTGAEPTVDFALAAIERVLGLPSGAAFTLFALGRVVGWIAHAMEQARDGRLIRPRARYIGEYEAGGAA